MKRRKTKYVRRVTAKNADKAFANGQADVGKIRVLTRVALDGRTRARKIFDAIAHGVAQDLGGENQLSTVQLHLVEAFAGIAITCNSINAKLLLGEEVDLMQHFQAVSSLCRIASRIGINRIAKNIEPDLATYLRDREKREVVE
jgi:hypothetical protein